MRVALGSDHGGFELKQEIIKYLEEKNIEYKDYGCYSTEFVQQYVQTALLLKQPDFTMTQTSLRLEAV